MDDFRYLSPSRPPRAISRRNRTRTYQVERPDREALRERRAQQPSPTVEALSDAGRTGSALRRSLKEQGIDPKQARLVLLFDRFRWLRVADVAWTLNISPSTASRWLDRAERDGLVDKSYTMLLDRRSTGARLTQRGHEFRQRVEVVLEGIRTNTRPRGTVRGIRMSRGLSW